MNEKGKNSVLSDIVLWGALWGIFEATFGYLLHAVSFGATWLIWYPAACFFMAGAYRRTERVSSVFLVGLLAAAIKMLNLLLPGRIDRVINPALSIVFEAAAMAAVIYVFKRFEGRAAPFWKALVMNAGWRALFAFWLLLAPIWIREISVISTVEKAVPFFVTQNLVTSALVGIGWHFKDKLTFPAMRRPARPAAAALLLALNIVLQFSLR